MAAITIETRLDELDTRLEQLTQHVERLCTHLFPPAGLTAEDLARNAREIGRWPDQLVEAGKVRP
jgi:hypothetical protein